MTAAQGKNPDAAPCCWREIHDWGDADGGRCEECLVMDLAEHREKIAAKDRRIEELGTERDEARRQRESYYRLHRDAKKELTLLEEVVEKARECVRFHDFVDSKSAVALVQALAKLDRCAEPEDPDPDFPSKERTK